MSTHDTPDIWPREILLAFLEPVRRRDRAMRGAAALVAGLAGGAMAAGIAALLGFADFAMRGWIALLAAIAVFSLVLAVLVHGAPTPGRLARRLDRQLGTGERLSTACQQDGPWSALPAIVRALHAEAREIAAALPRRGIRTGAEPALRGAFGALALALALNLVIAVWPAHPTRSAPDGLPPAIAPTAEDLSGLAQLIAEDAARGADPDLAAAALEIERLAEDTTRSGFGARQSEVLADALDMAAQGYGDLASAGFVAGPEAPSSAQRALSQWAETGEIVFGAAELGTPRTYARPLVAPSVRPEPQAQDDEDAPGAQTVNPSAALEVDTLPLAPDMSNLQTGGRTDDGTSDFIPPNLVVGDPRPAQAIDLAGVGQAERQESLTASAGGSGAFSAPEQRLPSDSTRGQILDIRSIPMEGQRIRYYLEAEHGVVGYDGVTAGQLPDWPPLSPAPVLRQTLGPDQSGAVARYFDRGGSAAP